MRLVLPQHIFAGQPVRAMVELENEKLTLPSFSLRVEATKSNTARQRRCSILRSIFRTSPNMIQ